MLHRGTFLTGAAATFASINVVKAPAKAAEFQYKFATNAPISHPLNTNAVPMWENVRKETNGRVDVKIFPNNQLGGDTAMLTQLRSGALQFFMLSGGILTNVVTVAGIQGVPFAFKSHKEVYAAFDGDLGAYVRKELETAGLFAFPLITDNGFRQITNWVRPIKTVNDLEGLKIRTPVGRLWVDLFKTLGAQVATINISEAYTALQTHVVDGQENPFIIIEFQRFYEVNKYLSMTNHMWDGYWFLANLESWRALGPDLQKVVVKHANIYCLAERRDNNNFNLALADKLGRQGMTFNNADVSTFKVRLPEFYARWKKEFGSAAWEILERYSGKLG
ncbi:MAG: DctP family TRAP transporter solute-binding subunit [Candidatus Eremiobacteraeota bacterium]|nr:DctP family TRAP transporter solute-binding subunit [Candidatus Eremiobacteraeota bacterium]